MSATIEFPFPTILQNLDEPVDATDSATKNYVDSKLGAGGAAVSVTGATMTGALEVDIAAQPAVTEINGGNIVLSSRSTASTVEIKDDRILVNKTANGGAPSDPRELVSKAYVDAAIQGLSFQASCKAATTTNITATYDNGTAGVGATLTGTGAPLVLDGYSLSTVGTRVLVKNQTTALQNGIYEVTTVNAAGSWTLTRAASFDQVSEVVYGSLVFIENGLANQHTSWVLITTGTITLGTTALTFTQFGAGVDYVAGAGIDIQGTSIINDGVRSIAGTTNQITATTVNNATTLSLPTAIDISGTIAVDAPTQNRHATNKQYVDTTTVSLSGDTMTGALSLSTINIGNFRLEVVNQKLIIRNILSNVIIAALDTTGGLTVAGDVTGFNGPITP
jgi:hypothetical protein